MAHKFHPAKNTLGVSPQKSIHHRQLKLLSFIVEASCSDLRTPTCSSSNLGILRGLAGATCALENVRLTVAFPFNEE